MQQVQREVVMAHLALMHMAASDISLLELATKPEEAAPFSRKRLKGQIEALATQSPVSFSLAKTSARPIFTSRAAKEAWEREHGLIGGDGDGR
jgi:purine-nucleoside phosphorylase